MAKHVVLGAMHWQLVDDKTGEVREGLKLYLLNSEPAPPDDGRVFGFVPMEMGAHPRLVSVMSVFPAVYDLDLEVHMKPGKDGKRLPVASVANARLLSPCKFEPVTAPAKA